MGLSAGRRVRSLVAAFALATLGSIGAAQANNFSTGSSCHNSDCHYTLTLRDAQGAQVDFRLPMPDQDLTGFKTAAIDLLEEFVGRGGLDFSDEKASSFVYMLERVAKDAGMGTDDFLAAINLAPARFEQYKYQQYRAGVMGDYNAVLEAGVRTDWNYMAVGLNYNDASIAQINKTVQEAARLHPEDPAFRVRPLNAGDLVNIRERVARQFVDVGFSLIKQFANGPLGQDEVWNLQEIVQMLYMAIQKDPSEARYEGDVIAGNDYNRNLIALMDAELNKRGQDRDSFYADLIAVYNFYDRQTPLEPVAPAVPQP